MGITLASCRVPVANGLFAGAKADGTHAVAHKTHAPINNADADRVINRVKAAFLLRFGGALPVRIQKVRTFGDLPHTILASAAAQGVQPTLPNVNPESAGDAEKTVFHPANAIKTSLSIC